MQGGRFVEQFAYFVASIVRLDQERSAFYFCHFCEFQKFKNKTKQISLENAQAVQAAEDRKADSADYVGHGHRDLSHFLRTELRKLCLG